MNSMIPTRVNFSELSTTELLLVMCEIDNRVDYLSRSKSLVKEIFQELLTDVHHALFAEFCARKDAEKGKDE